MRQPKICYEFEGFFEEVHVAVTDYDVDKLMLMVATKQESAVPLRLADGGLVERRASDIGGGPWWVPSDRGRRFLEGPMARRWAMYMLGG